MGTHKGAIEISLCATMDFAERVSSNTWQWIICRGEEIFEEIFDRHHTDPMTIHFSAQLVSDFVKLPGLQLERLVCVKDAKT